MEINSSFLETSKVFQLAVIAPVVQVIAVLTSVALTSSSNNAANSREVVTICFAFPESSPYWVVNLVAISMGLSLILMDAAISPML